MDVLRTAVLLAAGGAMLAAPVASFAAGKLDLGKREYEASCAVCHGKNGRGAGSFAEALQLSMPDLTTLSKRNGGVFPLARVYDVIDGREAMKAHGTREMPIWGRHLKAQAAPETDEYRYEPEAFVRARILTLIDYLYRLQGK